MLLPSWDENKRMRCGDIAIFPDDQFLLMDLNRETLMRIAPNIFRTSRNLLCMFILITLLLPLTAHSESLIQPNKSLDLQRKQYTSAVHALRNGNIRYFNELKAKLSHYPLHPYLEFQQLKRRITGAKPEEVTATAS